MQMNIDKIEKDDLIYPRRNVSRKLVDSYVEAIKAGAEFPPPEIQKIGVKKEGGEQEVKTISLDGWHRIEAYREYNQLEDAEPVEKIEVEAYSDEVLDREENLEELMIRSASLNRRHGNRLSEGDTKNHLKKIAENSPTPLEIKWKKVAERLGVTPGWVSESVSSILAKEKASRDAAIAKLRLLGYTYKKIAETLDTSKPTIAKAVKKFKESKNLTEKEKDRIKNGEAGKVARHHDWDVPLTWAVFLMGKPDVDRFAEIEKWKPEGPKPAKRLQGTLKKYNYWQMGARDKRFASKTEEHIQGRAVVRLLILYTRQEDLVVDPTAGDGVAPDACLLMNRRCRAFDAAAKNPKRRPDVEKLDFRKTPKPEGFKSELKGKADFIFLHPTIQSEYPENYMEELALRSKKTSADGGVVAVLTDANLRQKNSFKPTEKPVPVSIRTANTFEKVGFKPVWRFPLPYPKHLVPDEDTKWARKERKLLSISRSIQTFKK